MDGSGKKPVTEHAEPNPSHSETTPAGVIEELPNEATAARSQASADPLAVTKRLHREGYWNSDVEMIRDQMMRECRKSGMSKADAQAWTYSELDRLYPPLPPPPEPEPEVEVKPAVEECEQEGEVTEPAAAIDPETVELPPDEESRARTRDGRLQGLGDVPANWPKLPANASLAAEIAWVQANRLDVVEELPSGAIVVHLDRASEPAPSRASLGWLETSIRSYAKYVDVAAKATAQQEDEREHVRRERLAIEEVRALLAEMLDDQA